jgi:hypothetical protein
MFLEAMNFQKKVLLSVVLLVVAAWGFLKLVRHRVVVGERQAETNGVSQLPAVAIPRITTNIVLPVESRSKIKHRASEFTSDESADFATNFEAKYKPAIMKWCQAFEGHVPIKPESVTPKQLAERIGKDSSYNEYVFVVDGITLGVQDKKGIARVDYLNAPQQTRKLVALPDGSQTPTLVMPVTKREIMQMIEAESGRQFNAHEIRMTPSGLSGGLSGGVLVDVGGNPENGASWSYDMVFGPDGNLAYYLKGIDSQANGGSAKENR